MKKHILLYVTVSFIAMLLSGPVLANKTSVKIDAPADAIKGSTITVKINVFHSGNSFFHFTNWVYVKVNGKEISRWEFNKDARPENENFTKEVQIKVVGPLTIEAEGNCNVHGSTGITTVAVAVK